MLITDETKRVAQGALDYIVENPERHNQDSFISGLYTWTGNHAVVDEENLCHTTMCVAGTVQWQNDGYVNISNVGFRAAELLGLNSDEASTLFFDTNNAEAVDLLTAVANGDSAKFDELTQKVDDRVCRAMETDAF